MRRIGYIEDCTAWAASGSLETFLDESIAGREGVRNEADPDRACRTGELSTGAINLLCMKLKYRGIPI